MIIKEDPEVFRVQVSSQESIIRRADIMALHLTYLERINRLRKAGTPLIYLFEMWVNADILW
jgi:hypothetical protein